VADAQRLPFADEVVANIVMVDVRWHGPSHAADGARARAGAGRVAAFRMMLIVEKVR
jgi:hypothetical protein